MSRVVSMLVHLTLGVLCAVAIGCGGGSDNDGGTIPPTLSATFTPASSTPAANTLSLQAGNRSADIVQIRVAATDIADFFGGAFTISFDSTKARFVSMDTAGSFLRDGGISNDSLVFLEDHLTTAGKVVVTATRKQNVGGTQPGVNVTGTRNLLVFSFRAIAATAGTSFSLDAPREVINPADVPIVVTWSGGTLTAN